MTAPDYLTAAAALFDAFTFSKIIPLLALIVMMILVGYLLVKAQRKPGFNIEEMFLGEDNKVSAARVLAFMAFAFSSWDLMAARLSDKASIEQFGYYLFAWSGALVFVKAADRWNGSLPFGQPKA